jgi:hypothetical protein
MGIDFYYIATVPMYSRWLLVGMIVSCCLPIVWAIKNAYYGRHHWSIIIVDILGLRHTFIDPEMTVVTNFSKAYITFIFIIFENGPQLILQTTNTLLTGRTL